MTSSEPPLAVTPPARQAQKIVSTVEEGAAAVMRLAASRELEGHTGEYFDGPRPARANAQAYDSAARRRLAEVSARLTGLDPPQS